MSQNLRPQEVIIDRMKTFLMPEELSPSLIAMLMEAGLEIYKLDEKYIVIRPGFELPDGFEGAQKLIRPTNVMGKWAMSLTAKKILKYK